MTGTRVSLLDQLQMWAKDRSAPKIFWLNRMAGTGKSAIARSISRFLRQSQLLGGSFFCSRNDESRANVMAILPTLAWHLARGDPKYRNALLNALQQHPDVADYTIPEQVEKLLKVPFGNQDGDEIKHVFVIDALDECADPKDVKALLEAILSVSPHLPLKFFITSRPEPHIRSRFATSVSQSHRILHLHDIEQDIVEADIALYLTTWLKIIRFSSDDPEMFPSEWPSPGDIKKLTHLAGKLFIYAFTAVQYIEEHNHVERLETLTRSAIDDDDSRFIYRPLDTIYSFVLSAALDPNTCQTKEILRTKQILTTILAMREPLVLSDLARLLRQLSITPSDIRLNLGRIHAVVCVPPPGHDGVVSPFHASFVDFLTTPGRAPENQLIMLSAGHQDLAEGCLRIMASDLHFNISQCQTSYLSNSKQPLATISSYLKYSCFHWAYHLTAADNMQSLLSVVEGVLFAKFLFWLEVLSTTGATSMASNIISWALTGANTVGRTLELVITSAYTYAMPVPKYVAPSCFIST